jgi:Pyruvate/2-oxoacid:ferredoxin oxidoreductase delta subunit
LNIPMVLAAATILQTTPGVRRWLAPAWCNGCKANGSTCSEQCLGPRMPSRLQRTPSLGSSSSQLHWRSPLRTLPQCKLCLLFHPSTSAQAVEGWRPPQCNCLCCRDCL